MVNEKESNTTSACIALLYLHALVVFDIFLFTILIVSNTTGMAHLKIDTRCLYA
jgi:hypothetical protein